MSELDIPASWAESKLPELVMLQNGQTPKGLPSQAMNGEIPFFKVSDMNTSEDGKSLTNAAIMLSNIDVERFKLRLVQERSVIFPKNGGALLTNKKRFTTRQSAIDTNLMAAVPPPQIFEFFWNWFQTVDFNQYSSGSTVPMVSFNDIKGITVPIPPLAEQRRIVSKIESTFKRIEAIEKAVESAEVLSRKMALAFLKTDGDVQSTVGDSYSERIERCKNGGQGLRRVGVSNEHGVVDLRIADDVNTTRYKLVQKGDIFYNPMRLNVGSLALYDGNEQAITSPDYVVVKPRGIECSWLLYSFLKSEAGLKEIAKKTKGSVRERVYFKSLSEIEFPILTQQSNTAARRSFETFTQMLNGFGLAKQQFKAINSSVLSLAFSGRLVPQDPSEGTGHQLLEQILTAKTNSDSTKAPSPRAKKRKSSK